MPETRSRAHQEAAEEEGKTGVKKHKTESRMEKKITNPIHPSPMMLMSV